jgi:hypothetical protein
MICRDIRIRLFRRLVAVQNVKDRDAAVPLMAHVAYWKNKTVWTQLLEQIAA